MSRKKHIAIASGIAAVLLAITVACFNSTAAKIKDAFNPCFEEWGWESIEVWSEEAVNENLIARLINKDVEDVYFRRSPSRHFRIADIIAQNGFYGTAGKIVVDWDQGRAHLSLWVALKMDALPQTPERKAVVDAFFRQVASIYLKSFVRPLMLGQESMRPEVLKAFYPDLAEADPEESLELALARATPAFRKALLDHYDAERVFKGFPLSQVETFLKDWKPAAPKKGGYILVHDDAVKELPKPGGGKFNFYPYDLKMDTSRYQNDTLSPVLDPDSAQIVIFETYAYRHGGGTGELHVFLRDTTVRAVDAVTGRTIFNQTFRSERDNVHSSTRTSITVDKYDRKEYAKLIAARINTKNERRNG